MDLTELANKENYLIFSCNAGLQCGPGITGCGQNVRIVLEGLRSYFLNE